MMRSSMVESEQVSDEWMRYTSQLHTLIKNVQRMNHEGYVCSGPKFGRLPDAKQYVGVVGRLVGKKLPGDSRLTQCGRKYIAKWLRSRKTQACGAVAERTTGCFVVMIVVIGWD